MHLFLSQTFIDTDVLIRSDDHHHLSRVLRLKPGDAILITCGDGRVCSAVIEQIKQEETQCRVTEVYENYHESRVPLILCQGMLKNHGKLDWLVEKGTELGMTAFLPLHTAHTIAQSVKHDRLRKLAETATKQCIRGRIPEIRKPQHLTSALGEVHEARLLLFHESAALNDTPESLQLDERPIAMFIGPEGGFSEEEVESFRHEGADILSLGPRRLRGETAGLVALARVGAMVG